MVTDSSGHRARLRERFSRGGATALLDYEKLELLLTYAIPRSDTKDLAKELLKKFRSMGGVLHARPEQLQQVKGIGPNAASLLAIVREVAVSSMHEEVDKRDALNDRRSVNNFLRGQYGNRPDEYVSMLMLDSANRVMGAETLAEGTVNQCAIHPRTVVRKAILAGAAGMILAHNHPAGIAVPSEADWNLTKRLHDVGRLLDLPLLDHLIVCRDRVLSLRELPRWPN
jgi:DNA repair protein RadC